MKRSEVMHKLFGCKFPEGNLPCAIDSILNKQDTFIVAPIRARFAPIYATHFNMNGTTLIVEPTRSAARIQVAKLKDCGVAAECLDSKQTKKESANVLSEHSGRYVCKLSSLHKFCVAYCRLFPPHCCPRKIR